MKTTSTPGLITDNSCDPTARSPPRVQGGKRTSNGAAEYLDQNSWAPGVISAADQAGARIWALLSGIGNRHGFGNEREKDGPVSVTG
jgi:hypothetical protein